MASRRSQDNTIPESHALEAKPKKPSRMGSTKFYNSTDERPRRGPVCNDSKTFTRAPPFRNCTRMYSSTVLKDTAGNQDCHGAPRDGSKPVMSAPKVSASKEQRPSRQEWRMCYKAELVGSNVTVTREEGSSTRRTMEAKAPLLAAPQQKASTVAIVQSLGGGKASHEKSSVPKTQTPIWSDFDASTLGPTNSGRSSADACT